MTHTDTSSAPSEASAQRGDGRPVTSERQASFTAPGLAPQDGEHVAQVLQERLTSLVDLGLTLKHIHWNVVGPTFIAVHEMLDPQYEAVSAMVDAVAERQATLGGVPSGLPGRIVSTRNWEDYELGRADALSHLGALDRIYDHVIAAHRRAMDDVGGVDRVTEDLLIGQTAELEQFQWFVRSHLADWAGGKANAGADTPLDAARSVAAKQDPTRPRSQV